MRAQKYKNLIEYALIICIFSFLTLTAVSKKATLNKQNGYITTIKQTIRLDHL